MMKFEQSVVIDRPLKEVFGFATDLDTHAQWMVGLVESTHTSEGPVGLGTKYRYVMQMLGRKVETAGDVTEYERNRKYAWKATSGPFPVFQGSFLFEPLNGGTKVTMLAEAEPGGFFKLAEPLAAGMVRRQLGSSLSNLKDVLEAET
jgi:uncharacterized protein YndB with AHSA1/START domain